MMDIFDLKNLDDVPNEIQQVLQVTKRDQFEHRLIELYTLANRPLNLDEVVVGYFRMFNEHKERVKINTKLYNMARAAFPAVTSVKGKKGVYELTDAFKKKGNEQEEV